MRIPHRYNGPHHWREDHAPRNRRHKERAPALRMRSQASQSHREDRHETARLEHEHHDQQSQRRCPLRRSRRHAEHDTHPQVRREHIPRLDGRDHHQNPGHEAVERIHALRDSQEIARLASCSTRLFSEVDNIPRDRNLRADIAELRERRKEEGILLPERSWIGRAELRNLPLLYPHIRIGDLRERREEEEDNQQTHEPCDAEVRPLDILQPLGIIDRMREEDAARQ